MVAGSTADAELS